MAAGVAASRGKDVLLIEKNAVLGKKLSITGGGRCNITNATFDVHTFLEKFPESKKFLFSPFTKFAVEESFEFFENTLNLPLTTQAKNRVFPVSEKATDVTKALTDYANLHGVQVMYSSPVTQVSASNDCITSVTCNKEKFEAKKFLLATGGLAAPETGSTGDGFHFLESLGHTVVAPDPSIVPLTTDATWLHKCTGTTLENVTITFSGEGHKNVQAKGNILLTHFGLSGPTILNCAKDVTALLRDGTATTTIDLFPQLSEADLDKQVLSTFEQNKNKICKNVLPLIIPRNLSEAITKQFSQTLSETPINEISKEQRKYLVKKLKHITFQTTGTLNYDKAVIADGGIISEEVNFTNMTSRIYPNLYLTGDTLCINRPSGGYSLQLAWTTAWVAANDC